jgi:hypothetical protein
MAHVGVVGEKTIKNMEYFKNEEVNEAFISWSWLNPATAHHSQDDKKWYKFLFLLFKNGLSFDETILEERSKEKNYHLTDDDISKIMCRYEDLREFYKYITEQGDVKTAKAESTVAVLTEELAKRKKETK